MTSKKAFNVLSEKCPSRNVLEGVSDKWSILIIHILSKNMYRFGEMKREIGGISPKMLTQTLQKLEKFGFVKRTSFPVLPIKVEYKLTQMGAELSTILNALTLWTEKNMDNILASEMSFERKKS